MALAPLWKLCPNIVQGRKVHNHETMQGWCKGHGQRSKLSQVYPYNYTLTAKDPKQRGLKESLGVHRLGSNVAMQTSIVQKRSFGHLRRPPDSYLTRSRIRGPKSVDSQSVDPQSVDHQIRTGPDPKAVARESVDPQSVDPQIRAGSDPKSVARESEDP